MQIPCVSSETKNHRLFIINDGYVAVVIVPVKHECIPAGFVEVGERKDRFQFEIFFLGHDPGGGTGEKVIRMIGRV